MLTREEKVRWLMENAIPSGECLLCHLAPNAKGYCNVTFGRQTKERVHRLVFFVCNPEEDPNLIIRHTCDTRNCINPKHLLPGTYADNTKDMIERGRAKFVQPRTDHIHRDRIIELHKAGLSRTEIAQKLFISPTTVWNYISPKGVNYVHQS
jgi:hypothetical protein